MPTQDHVRGTSLNDDHLRLNEHFHCSANAQEVHGDATPYEVVRGNQLDVTLA